MCTIVGDAFARPLLAALDAEPERWDLSSLRAITSSGVTWSPETKRGLLAHLPGVTLIDSLGASEGIMTRTETRATDDIAPARFKASDRLVVVTDDGEVAQPGDEQIGMLGVGGAIPLGYYKDEEKTAATFRTVERAPLFDPGRLRHRRDRRHDPPARAGLGVHQHRRREGVSRRGGARACARIPTCSTASSSAFPTHGGARWSSRSSNRPTA